MLRRKRGAWHRAALGPCCVKTCRSRECAELFSPFSSFDGDCQSGSFLIQCNRDKLSTRKFNVGVFAQPGSKTEGAALRRDVCFGPVSGHRQLGGVRPKSANFGLFANHRSGGGDPRPQARRSCRGALFFFHFTLSRLQQTGDPWTAIPHISRLCRSPLSTA
jgi:hypothetical protein